MNLTKKNNILYGKIIYAYANYSVGVVIDFLFAILYNKRMNKNKIMTILIIVANVSFFVLLINAIIQIIFLTKTHPEYFYEMGYGYPGAVVCYMLYNNVVLDSVDVFNEVFKYIMYISGLTGGVFYYVFFKRVENKYIVDVSTKSYYDIKTKTIKTEEKFVYHKEGIALIPIIAFYICTVCVVGIPWWIYINKSNKESQRQVRLWIIRSIFIAFIFTFILVFGGFSCFDMNVYGRF